MPNIPTIAVKESRADLLEIGPSTGLSGFRLVYVIGKGLYRWRTGDQSGNVPGGNGGDNWIAPSEDTSGKSGAWERLTPENTTGVDGNVVTGTAGTDGNLGQWNTDGDLVDSGLATSDVATKTFSAQMDTGSYTGDGSTSQGITGLGFQPSYVRIWKRITSDLTDMSIFETTADIVDDNANGLAIQIAESAGTAVIRTIDNTIISLDADGFTVDDAGGDNDPNANTQVYNYLAIG